MKTLIALAALTLVAAPLTAAAQSADNSVALTFDVGAHTGAVMVALFDQTGYGGGAPVRAARIDASGAQPQVVFDHLPAGDYAVKVFHDVDGDGKMNTNPFGLPTEPYGFSNNAVGNMGPASWERARFTVSGAVAQTLRLR